MIKRSSLVTFLFILLLFAWSGIGVCDSQGSEEGYYTIYDIDTNQILFTTAWSISKGDRYHSKDNKLYEVVDVIDEKTAYAKYIKAVLMPNVSNVFSEISTMVKLQGKKKKIGLYFTHTDESYLPTSGTFSEYGNGDIIQIGRRLKKESEEKDIQVIVDSTLHDPHNAAAYIRSRRTATNLLKNGTDLLLDIHRDGVPKEQYLFNLNGITISKTRIVIGRSNQNMNVNSELAKTIKALADEKYPGLIKDIFYGKGSYNQDIFPRSLLLEIGTYTHSQEYAEQSTVYLADILRILLTSQTFSGEAQNDKGSEFFDEIFNIGSSVNAALIIGIVGGLIIFLLNLDKGKGFSKFKKTKEELSNYLGRKNKRKK